MMEAATMPTVCLRFRFEEHPKIRALMEVCADIQRQAIAYALENGKTATFTIIKALYPSLRAQYPNLHSNLIYGAIRSGARVVHVFRNQQRRGKTQADRPEIRRPSIYLARQTVGIEWDGETLIVTIPVSPRDPDPIVLTFRPHHKYRRLLDEWKAGWAKMGEPTLTAHSLSIPLKFPDPIPYEPEGVIGIDSNEGNLTAFRDLHRRDPGDRHGSMWGRSTGTICGARSKGQEGSATRRRRRRSPPSIGRIRKQKVENFWHHLALALIAWAHRDEGGSGAGGPSGDEGADRGGKVQEDAAAPAQLLVDYEVPPHLGAQGKILRRSAGFCGSAKHVPGVSGMRQGG
jgi:hypothetical protein